MNLIYLLLPFEIFFIAIFEELKNSNAGKLQDWLVIQDSWQISDLINQIQFCLFVSPTFAAFVTLYNFTDQFIFIPWLWYIFFIFIMLYNLTKPLKKFVRSFVPYLRDIYYVFHTSAVLKRRPYLGHKSHCFTSITIQSDNDDPLPSPACNRSNLQLHLQKIVRRVYARCDS